MIDTFLLENWLYIVCLLAFPALRYVVWPSIRGIRYSIQNGIQSMIDNSLTEFISSWKFPKAIENANNNKDEHLAWVLKYKCHVNCPDKDLGHFEEREVRDVVKQLHELIIQPYLHTANPKKSLIQRIEILERAHAEKSQDARCL